MRSLFTLFGAMLAVALMSSMAGCSSTPGEMTAPIVAQAPEAGIMAIAANGSATFDFRADKRSGAWRFRRTGATSSSIPTPSLISFRWAPGSCSRSGPWPSSNWQRRPAATETPDAAGNRLSLRSPRCCVAPGSIVAEYALPYALSRSLLLQPMWSQWTRMQDQPSAGNAVVQKLALGIEQRPSEVEHHERARP